MRVPACDQSYNTAQHPVSIDLVAAALWLPLEPNRKLVLIALCERADLATGRCWPGREEVALRSSLSVKSVTPHFGALESAGWIRRTRRGNARLGETTTRWLDVQKILNEGEAARQAFLQERRERLQTSWDDSSPDQLALLESGEVDGNDQGKLGNDQGKLTDGSGEAASLVTVIEPSDQPSYDPSSRESVGTPTREGAVRSTYVGPAAESTAHALPSLAEIIRRRQGVPRTEKRRQRA